MRIAAWGLGSLLVFASLCPAQNVTGSITGVVKDPTGAVIPNAQVTVINTGTNAKSTATSDAEGVYTFRALPIGVYDLSAAFSGFRNFETKGIRLQVNETARVDILLAVGQSAEAVTVSAEVVNVDTSTATLKTVVDQKRIEELPLNGRNPTQLMRLVAGVQLDVRADVTSGTTYPGVAPVSVNGGRANATNYVLDGAQNNDHYSNAANPMPNPDALAEFSVQTNNFSAEFGRNVGGLVNAVTRSGTNELHGSAFEYVRNKALNAANFFAPITNGVKKDDGLKRNQYGATLGGPVWLPRVYDGKDRTFFFFSYQGTRLRRTPSSVNSIVPTAAQKRGDFSELLPGRQLRNPFGGGVYPNNLIPASQINPIAQYIVDNRLPTPVGGSRIAYSTVANQDDDQWLVRGDHQLSPRHKMSARYWHSFASQPGSLDPQNYLSTATIRTWWNTSVTYTDTHTFSPTLLNTALFGFNRTIGPATQVRPEKGFADLGSKIYNDDLKQIYVAVSGYFTMNTGDTNTFYRDEYQFSDTIRWTRGRHQLTFGGEYGKGFGDIVNNFRADGRFSFNGSAPFTGESLADLMVGKFQNFTQGIGEYKNTRFNIFSLFFQDSMRLTRRLTVDLGMRWDPYFPYTDLLGRVAAWRPGQQSTRYTNAPRGVLYAGDPGLSPGGFNRVWNNFGPRAGFAWDVFGNGKTSLRGGYGIFFDRQNTIATNPQANQGPFGTVVSLDGNNVNSMTDPYAGATNPFPAPLNPPSDVKFVLPHNAVVWEEHMRNPYLQAFNLTLEREVAAGFIARIAYAGSKGTRLNATRELNPAVYAPAPPPPPPTSAGRCFPTASAISTCRSRRPTPPFIRCNSPPSAASARASPCSPTTCSRRASTTGRTTSTAPTAPTRTTSATTRVLPISTTPTS